MFLEVHKDIEMRNIIHAKDIAVWEPMSNSPTGEYLLRIKWEDNTYTTYCKGTKSQCQDAYKTIEHEVGCLKPRELYSQSNTARVPDTEPVEEEISELLGDT